MPEVTIRVDSYRLTRALDEMPEELAKNMAPALRAVGREWQRELTRNRLSGQRGSIGLNRRTGNLARSVSYLLVGKSLDDMALELIVAAPYAAVHERGGMVNIPAHQVSAHQVQAHKRQGVPVKAHMRGPYTRSAHAAEYKPRLGAVDTLLSIVPSIEAKLNDAIKKTLEEAV